MTLTKATLISCFLIGLTGCVSAGQESKPKTQVSTSVEKIMESAKEHNVSERVVRHVAKKESTFRCSPGGKTYYGPLQISYSSARALGYRGPRNGLDNCDAGLEYGMRHLALCNRVVGDNPSKAARCHAMPGNYGVTLRWPIYASNDAG